MARMTISSFLPLALLALLCFISMASAQSGTGSVASSTANGTYSAPAKTASSTSSHSTTSVSSSSTPSSLVSTASNSLSGSGSGNEVFALLLAGVVGSLVFGL